VKRKASELLEGEEEWEKFDEDDEQFMEGLDDGLGDIPHERGEDDDEALTDRRHGKEIVPNPKPKGQAPPPEEEWWDCPICLRPQAANERQFNEHIDLCLSRQTIRDAVQADEPKDTKPVSPDSNKRPKLIEKKRGRPPITDPKQKKLTFG
jgi:DNA polymerase kappa